MKRIERKKIVNETKIESLARLFPEYKEIFWDHSDERARRRWAALEAREIGRGGVKIISEITGLDKKTIYRGMKENNDPGKIDFKRIRLVGGGRHNIEQVYPGITARLQEMLEADLNTCGYPENLNKWTVQRVPDLTIALRNEGYNVSESTVRRLSKRLGYSLQGNRKYKESGRTDPDRDNQFQHINSQIALFKQLGYPVISIDCKNKEQLGEYKNDGKTLRAKGNPLKVLDHDFTDKEKGKAAPYGVFDITQNICFVTLNKGPDTALYAVNAISLWWWRCGCWIYPDATKLLITCDGGGSNSSKSRLFATALQKFSEESGLEILVCHYPPLTSKYNKIEHQVFSYISIHWRGIPFYNLDVMRKLISETTTKPIDPNKPRLMVMCSIDNNTYKTGTRIINADLAKVNIVRNEFRGDWNYTILPHPLVGEAYDIRLVELNKKHPAYKYKSKSVKSKSVVA